MDNSLLDIFCRRYFCTQTICHSPPHRRHSWKNNVSLEFNGRRQESLLPGNGLQHSAAMDPDLKKTNLLKCQTKKTMVDP
jgi:hypothetical protein